MMAKAQQYAEQRFILYLNKHIRARSDEVYLLERPQPVDGQFVRANTFYAKVLVDVVFGKEPTIDQFRGMGFAEGDNAIFKTALYLYRKWHRMGVLSAVFGYCQYANKMMDHALARNGLYRHENLPDFREDVMKINRELKSLTSSE